MEPRVAVGDYTSHDGHSTLYTTSQNPHVIRLLMGAFVLNIPEHKLRVVAPDVGGGFGTKIFHYAEEAFCTFAAKRAGAPGEVDVDALGGLHVRRPRPRPRHEDRAGAGRRPQLHRRAHRDDAPTWAPISRPSRPSVPTWLHGTLMAGNYRTPLVYVNVKAVFTNTVPVDAYRGAGRPEATFQLERVIDKAARELGVDPVELRRKNFIREFPYQTPVAVEYDTGDYDATMDKLLEMIDREGFPARRRESEARGKLRGLGFNCYIEACGIAPSKLVGQLGARAGLYESATVRVNADRRPRRHDRQPQPRAGARDLLRAGRRRHDRHPRGPGRDRARRHRQGADGHGHLRLALARGRRLGHVPGDREDHRQGQEDRRRT